MRGFSFRLQKVLNYRSYLEKMSQRDLVSAKREHIETKREISELSGRRIETAKLCSQEGLRGVDAPVYLLHKSFIGKLDRDLEASNIKLERTVKKLRSKEEALKKKSVERKTLEFLKDLQFKRHMELIEALEQKELDEMAVLRGGSR